MKVIVVVNHEGTFYLVELIFNKSEGRLPIASVQSVKPATILLGYAL